MSEQKRNMYGCTPCPKCQDEYRWPTQFHTIVCEDCGYSEPAGDADPKPDEPVNPVARRDT